MTKDLTEGKPLSLILGFSIPVLLGYVFQQFYNVVDTVIVSKILGVEALAAVGSTGSVNFLIIGFCMGLCSGFAIPLAQKFGAKDFRLMRQYAFNAGILCILFSIVLTILTVVFCRPILVAMQTPADIIDRAVSYIRIIFCGIPLIILYNMVSSIIRALGDSKTPVYFLVLSSLLNIGLDLLFILVFRLDVAGAALATIISQGIAGLACLIYMGKKFEILRFTEEDKKIKGQHFKTLCNVGIPMGLQYSITAIGSVILQASVNSLGSGVVAAVTAASRIGMFFCTPFDALGTTMATFGGQNTGAGNFERLKTGVRASALLGLIYSLIAWVIMYFFGTRLSLLFLSPEATQIIANAHRFLIITSAFYFPLALVNIVRFMIQGMGFSRFAVLSGMLEMVARMSVALIAVPLWGFSAVCFASPAAWLLADCFLIPAFFSSYRKLENLQKQYELQKEKGDSFSSHPLI
ncbi:putative efflux protein, MATE family [Sphaerochaeta pleomorpha str. Grapes]|uniref:Putative efflux protein, MATE family n=1 Tax=Sphaerochaeta pleomorpha (strain ATCC BAA-1885 / DSM 22778 / Grapes) TaxID=158190 RepID=G8QTX7_SPHPG|nr:MATE family efflux transporter [Sphaerochaeta pleomorpha]AEV29153.1 putative efflux protein, MATE family [Sphaerochaeta pleomorpha str. Grapes]